MIVELKELRQRTRDRALAGSFQAAIDRLEALAYRLNEAAATVRSAVPPAPSAPIPEPAPLPPPAPQRALPLGPVIVVARKPRRR